MKILVTGATGFIGSYIVQELVARGDDFAVLDIQPASKVISGLGKAIKWYEGDVRSSEGSIKWSPRFGLRSLSTWLGC